MRLTEYQQLEKIKYRFETHSYVVPVVEWIDQKRVSVFPMLSNRLTVMKIFVRMRFTCSTAIGLTKKNKFANVVCQTGV